MTFEVKVVKVELSPEENQRRIARIARWLLAVCGDLLETGSADNTGIDNEALMDSILQNDALDDILEMTATTKFKRTRKR